MWHKTLEVNCSQSTPHQLYERLSKGRQIPQVTGSYSAGGGALSNFVAPPCSFFRSFCTPKWENFRPVYYVMRPRLFLKKVNIFHQEKESYLKTPLLPKVYLKYLDMMIVIIFNHATRELRTTAARSKLFGDSLLWIQRILGFRQPHFSSSFLFSFTEKNHLFYCVAHWHLLFQISRHASPVVGAKIRDF